MAPGLRDQLGRLHLAQRRPPPLSWVPRAARRRLARAGPARAAHAPGLARGPQGLPGLLAAARAHPERLGAHVHHLRRARHAARVLPRPPGRDALPAVGRDGRAHLALRDRRRAALVPQPAVHHPGLRLQGQAQVYVLAQGDLRAAAGDYAPPRPSSLLSPLSSHHSSPISSHLWCCSCPARSCCSST